MDKLEAEARVVAELATKATGYELSDAIREKLATPVIINNNRELVSLESFLPRPIRIREQAKLKSVGSFIDYVNLHKNASSIITANEDTNQFKVIVDYHDSVGPNYSQHTGTLTLERTTPMKAWLDANGRKMGQEAFGLFIEENAADIVDPAAAVMLQVATELRAIKSVDFESKVALDNGAFVFAYKEDVKGTLRDGQTSVPQTFKIGVTPYRGMSEAYGVTARLRYRVRPDGLEMWYSITELDRLLETAFNEVRDTIANGTGLKVFDGSI
jgi:uncharacterized protein YfdQ (DUF2303 family)